MLAIFAHDDTEKTLFELQQNADFSNLWGHENCFEKSRGSRIRGLNDKEILSKGNDNWFKKSGISRNRSKVQEIRILLY